MKSPFKKGDPAKYIGNKWKLYTGSVLTVTSDLKYGTVHKGSTGKKFKIHYHTVRFFDGFEYSDGRLLAVPPKDLRPIEDPYPEETETTGKQLELMK